MAIVHVLSVVLQTMAADYPFSLVSSNCFIKLNIIEKEEVF
jgi:hypothetical protein